MYFKSTNESKDYRIFYKVEETSILTVRLAYDKDLPSLLTNVELSTFNPKDNLTIENIHNLGLPISINEFEDAVKKATNHIIRQLVAPDILLVKKSELDKKISIDYGFFDSPILIIK